MSFRRCLVLVLLASTAVGLWASLPSPEIQFVLLEKRSEWVVAGNGVLTPAPDDPGSFSAPFGFRVQVEGNNLNGISPAPTFTTAGGVGLTPAMIYNAQDGSWNYRPAYGSQALLDGAYFNGDYTVTVGGTTLDLTLSGDAYPAPPMPVIEGGQWCNGILYVDSSQPLTLSTGCFEGFGVTGVLSHISMDIFGMNTSVSMESFSPNSYVEGNLSTGSLSYAFGAGDLVSGQTYKVAMEFNTIVDVSTQLEGALGAALYTSYLTFEIQTLAPIPEPGSYAAALGLATFGLVIACRRRLKMVS